MELSEWLQIGRDNHWVSQIICETHDGTPMSESKWKESEEGDPCILIMRVYNSKEHKIEVEGNNV
jgi:hypothetical protein